MNEKSDAKCKISQDDAKCSNSIVDESDSECFRSMSDAYEIFDEIESERIMSLSITFKRIRKSSNYEDVVDDSVYERQ